MRKLLNILTPENVFVEYELAGTGSRFIAAFIDYLIQVVLLMIVAFAIGFQTAEDIYMSFYGNSLMAAIGIIIIFLINAGYFIFFEMILNGQSPGKKVVKLKVIKENGAPINFLDSMIRNIVRLVDMMPTMYLVGALVILFTKQYKRIGDFAAGTVVVKIKTAEQPVTLDRLIAKAEYGLTHAETANKYPVTNFEYSILKEFLERKYSLGERRDVFLYHLNNYFRDKFKIEPSTNMNPYILFEEIIKSNSGV
ncbi:MAG: RDD family protein [Clostridia bacterium]|nr:RDD family protein [Clostridia bacterium]